MEIQLQELIDQIKKEGVESAEKQAQEIIESAKAEAEKITANAQAQADKMIAKRDRSLVNSQESTF
jgi:V/A-type H+-transporting ATPase subunit E